MGISYIQYQKANYIRPLQNPSGDFSQLPEHINTIQKQSYNLWLHLYRWSEWNNKKPYSSHKPTSYHSKKVPWATDHQFPISYTFNYDTEHLTNNKTTY